MGDAAVRWQSLAATYNRTATIARWLHPFKARRQLEAMAKIMAIEPTWWESNGRLRRRLVAHTQSRANGVEALFRAIAYIPPAKLIEPGVEIAAVEIDPPPWRRSPECPTCDGRMSPDLQMRSAFGQVWRCTDPECNATGVVPR